MQFYKIEGCITNKNWASENKNWEIRDERDGAVYYLSELSFKEKSYPEAAENRQMVMDALLERGILLKVDSLKTQQMLDAYLVSP